jgi:hypothetical protein
MFCVVFLVGCLLSFRAGGIAGSAYLVAQVGQIWLLVLIIRECHSDAVFYALVIPFFTWYFALQRWDIAKWALVCNMGGILLMLLATCSGVSR